VRLFGRLPFDVRSIERQQKQFEVAYDKLRFPRKSRSPRFHFRNIGIIERSGEQAPRVSDDFGEQRLFLLRIRKRFISKKIDRTRRADKRNDDDVRGVDAVRFQRVEFVRLVKFDLSAAKKRPSFSVVYFDFSFVDADEFPKIVTFSRK